MHSEYVQLLMLLTMIFSAFQKVLWQHFSGVVDRFKTPTWIFVGILCSKNYCYRFVFEGNIQKIKMWPLFGHSV